MEDDLDKQDNGALVPLERWMARVASPWVPAGVSANQVTLVSGLMGIAAGACYWLASYQRAWLALAFVLVLLHWVGDNVDGHIARTRNQCSQSGRFLDIFFDALTFAALGIGIACSSFAQFHVVAIATLFALLQYVLTLLWIALTRIWPFPAFGPAESHLSLLLMTLAVPFVPASLFTLGGVGWSLMDVAFALTIPSSVITLWVSGRALYRHLQAQDQAAAPSH